jgi:uncharacterized protein (TIGR02145 family)
MSSVALRAQITIGDLTPSQPYSILEISTDQTKGGLRLPQLTTLERNDLTLQGDLKAQGLTIYNTDTKCYEYWNDQKWVSLCSGTADITLSPPNELPKQVGVIGYGPSAPITPEDNPQPSCGNSAPYTIGAVSGSEFVSITLSDQSTGTFTYSVDENLTALPRVAVIRITNNCTGEYKEYLITQEGNTALCNSSATKPTIDGTNNGTLCTGGSVILTVASPEAGKTYVWLYKGNEVGRGTYYAATRPGDYTVYVGAVGCEDNKSDPYNVKANANTAGQTVFITASNNGIVCGSMGYTTLVANNAPATGSGLRWFKNGVLQSGYDNTSVVKLVGEVHVGDWFAAVEEAECLSMSSNIVTVTYNSTVSEMPAPTVTVNGVPLTAAELCSNGQIDLVQTYDYIKNLNVSVTVKWYLYTGNCQGEGCKVGEGDSISIITPNLPNGEAILSCVVVDNTNTYCSREVTETKTLNTSPAPNAASIIGSDICGSLPATLTANASAASYRWYRNGIYDASLSGQTITTSQVASYQVSLVSDGGCRSSLSGSFNVNLSDFPTLSWTVVPPTTTQPGTTRIFSVSASFNPTNYVWTLEKADGSHEPAEASVSAGQGSPTVSILFPEKETVNVIVTATNGCGNNYTFAPHEIDVKEECVPPQIMNITPISGTRLVGSSFTLTVSATGSDLKYTWKLDGKALENAANHIAGQSTNTLIMNSLVSDDKGTYTCDVETESTFCNGEIVTGTAGTITVIAPQAGSLENGKFISGETCFDVNTGANNNTECGATANRTTMNLAGIYTYTFQHVTANRSLQFMLEDALNAVELIGFSTYSGELLSPIPLGDPAVALSAINTALSGRSFTAGSAYSITLKFKNTLNQLGQNPSAYGTTDNNPVMVRLSALYQDNAATYRMESLAISIKDCFCCGIGGTAIPFKAAASGNIYLTHQYPTGIGNVKQCWMVSNSKEGLYTSTCYFNNCTSYPEDRGYYYDWTRGHNESNVCPNGWKLPEETEADRLLIYLKGSSSITPDVRKWWIGSTLIAAHAAGARASGNNQTWVDWGTLATIYAKNNKQYGLYKDGTTSKGEWANLSQGSVRCVWNY